MEEKIMVPSLLTAANWPIVGQLCWILGKVDYSVYDFCVYIITSTYD